MKIQGISHPGNDHNLFSELAESIKDIFFILDHKFNVIYWNVEAEKITGIEKEKILNFSIYDFFPAIKNEPIDKTIKEALKTKQIQTCEQNYTLEGKQHIFETRVSPCSLGLFVYSKDLTEHKKEVEQEKRRKEFFQTIIDNIPVYLLRMSHDNKTKWVNIPFQNQLGYSSGEIKELNALNKLFTKNQEIDPATEFINIPENTWKDFYTHTKGGKQIVTSWTIAKLSDKSKIGIGQDVTEKKEQFEELTQINQHINTIIYNLPLILFSADFEGRYKTLMGMGLEELDLNPEELIGKSAYQIFGNLYFETSREEVNTVKEAMNSVMMDKQVSGILNIKDNYLRVRLVAEKDNDGEITGILGVALDITEKYETEKKLESTNRLLQKTLDSLKEVVLVIGVEETRGIVLCNSAVKEMFGYEPEELIGKTTRHFYPNEESFLEFGRIGEESLDKYGSFHGEYEMVRKDGKIITTEHTIKPLDEKKGWRNGVVSVIRDISERKKYMKQNEEYSKRLKNLNRHLQKIQEDERKNIARDIHDEIGQIFSILKFNLTSLSKDIKDNKTQPDTDYILDEIEAMKSMTNKAIQSTRKFISELRPVAIDHMELDESLLWLCNDFETRTGINTNFNNKAKNLSVNDDIKINLFRILQETLTNVRKHSMANKVNILLERKKGQIKLDIQDNGTGIKEKDKKKMSSFGLLGIQERVNDMKGNIEIEGKENEGTRIIVTTPQK